MNISFFGRPPYWGTNNHAHRISTYIRGVQMAERLGGRFNPTENVEDDTCVYIKPCRVRQGIDTIKIAGKKTYLDIVDDTSQLKLLEHYPKMKAIACSKADYETLKQFKPDIDLLLIPQHHCNFERVRRDRTGVVTVGALGGMLELPKGLREGLAERGLAFIECTNFFTRQDVVNFYTSIDIQIVWRPWIVNNKLSNPLKIVNAASFGVPTIALYEPVFDEVAGAFKPTNNVWDLLYYVDMLRTSKDLYAEFEENGLAIAEAYHIDNICKLYGEL